MSDKIYPLVISLVRDEDLVQLPETILEEGERVFYREGSNIRIIESPSGEGFIFFKMNDFMNINTGKFLGDLVNTLSSSSSNKIYKLTVNYNKKGVSYYYNSQIRCRIMRIVNYFSGNRHPNILIEEVDICE